MRQNGMSLVELMIVVLLIGILAVATSPFTASWVNSAHVTETIGIVEQAVGQARAAALRNPTARSGSEPASMICNDNTNHLIKIVVPTTPPNTTPPTPFQALSCGVVTPPLAQPWSSKVANNVAIKMGTATDAAAWACTCFTNKGLITKVNAACNACNDSLELTISSGNEIETITFN